MKINYLELLKKHSLNVGDLSEDIQIGIKSIKGIERAINMQEKKGANTDKAVKKAEREDRIVCSQIEEHVKEKGANGSQNNEADEKLKKEAAEKEKLEKEQKEKSEKEQKEKAEKEEKDKKESGEKPKADPKGMQIDKELSELIKAGKLNLTAEELKSSAPTTYNEIFQAYKKGEDNGCVTSHYQCLETEAEKFTVSKV